MDISVISNHYIVFTVSSEFFLGKREAETTVRQILSEHFIPQWENIHIDMFTLPENALYIAYPESGIKIRIADYALPFIEEYFTE